MGVCSCFWFISGYSYHCNQQKAKHPESYKETLLLSIYYPGYFSFLLFYFRYREVATAQLAMGRSPLDVQRQMGHTTLQMTNKYASLTIGHLKKLHERHSPLRADTGGSTEVFGAGYWDECLSW